MVPNTYTKKIFFYFAFEGFYFVTVGYFWSKGVPVCNYAMEEIVFENVSFN